MERHGVVAGALAAAMKRHNDNVGLFLRLRDEPPGSIEVVDTRHAIVMSKANDGYAFATHVEIHRWRRCLETAGVLDALVIEHAHCARPSSLAEISAMVITHA